MRAKGLVSGSFPNLNFFPPFRHHPPIIGFATGLLGARDVFPPTFEGKRLRAYQIYLRSSLVRVRAK
jgi:hypothetical protein